MIQVKQFPKGQVDLFADLTENEPAYSTSAPPGSFAKIEVMRLRLERMEHLHHGLDNGEIVKQRELCSSLIDSTMAQMAFPSIHRSN